MILAMTLLLLPALCAGGVILHACDCGSEAPCSHELTCSDDPCELDLARPACYSDLDADSISRVANNLHIAIIAMNANLPTTFMNIKHELQYLDTGTGIPFPQSDLPLQI